MNIEIEERKLDNDEYFLLNNIKNYELFLNENKDEFIGKANEGYATEVVEKKCLKLLKEFMKDKIKKISEDDFEEGGGKKSVFDFKFRDIFFDSKTSLTTKEIQKNIFKEFNGKKIYENDFTAKELKDFLIDKGSKYYTKKNVMKDIWPKSVPNKDLLIDIFNKLDNNNKDDFYKLIIEKKENKKSGGAQLISWNVALNDIYKKKQPLFYVIANIFEEDKKYKVKSFDIINFYEIDFMKYPMYLSGQFYYNKEDFKRISEEEQIKWDDINNEYIIRRIENMLKATIFGKENMIKIHKKDIKYCRTLLKIDKTKEDKEFIKNYNEKIKNYEEEIEILQIENIEKSREIDELTKNIFNIGLSVLDDNDKENELLKKNKLLEERENDLLKIIKINYKTPFLLRYEIEKLYGFNILDMDTSKEQQQIQQNHDDEKNMLEINWDN